MPLLEVVGVSKVFPGVRALDDVSFTLQPGEVHALVGENGAGKSTLIKVLTGVYQPDGGEVRYRDEPAAFATPMDAQKAGISTIYQEVNLIPLMSVAHNLFLGREPRTRFGTLDEARMNREAAEMLSRYGVTADPRRQLGTLALGAQQMVALARAVMIDARVGIMDDPTSSLEPREVETLFGVIRELHAQGIGIVYVSHRLDELYQICDAVTILRDGKLVHTGKLAELERIKLVSLMLGRDMSEVRREGATAFSGETTGDAEAAPVLRAQDLNSRHKLHDISFEVRPGEVVGLAGGRRVAGPPDHGQGGQGGDRDPARGPQGRGDRRRVVRTREHRSCGPASDVPARGGVRREDRRGRRQVHEAAPDQGVQPQPAGR